MQRIELLLFFSHQYTIYLMKSFHCTLHINVLMKAINTFQQHKKNAEEIMEKIRQIVFQTRFQQQQIEKCANSSQKNIKWELNKV